MNYCIVLAVQDPDFGVQLSLRTFPCPFSLAGYEVFLQSQNLLISPECVLGLHSVIQFTLSVTIFLYEKQQ